MFFAGGYANEQVQAPQQQGSDGVYDAPREAYKARPRGKGSMRATIAPLSQPGKSTVIDVVFEPVGDNAAAPSDVADIPVLGGSHASSVSAPSAVMLDVEVMPADDSISATESAPNLGEAAFEASDRAQGGAECEIPLGSPRRAIDSIALAVVGPVWSGERVSAETKRVESRPSSIRAGASALEEQGDASGGDVLEDLIVQALGETRIAGRGEMEDLGDDPMQDATPVQTDDQQVHGSAEVNVSTDVPVFVDGGLPRGARPALFLDDPMADATRGRFTTLIVDVESGNVVLKPFVVQQKPSLGVSTRQVGDQDVIESITRQSDALGRDEVDKAFMGVAPSVERLQELLSRGSDNSGTPPDDWFDNVSLHLQTLRVPIGDTGDHATSVVLLKKLEKWQRVSNVGSASDAQVARLLSTLNLPNTVTSFAAVRKLLRGALDRNEPEKVQRATPKGLNSRYMHSFVLVSDRQKARVRHVLGVPFMYKAGSVVGNDVVVQGVRQNMGPPASMTSALETPGLAISKRARSPIALSSEGGSVVFVDNSQEGVQSQCEQVSMPELVTAFLVQCMKYRFNLFKVLMYRAVQIINDYIDLDALEAGTDIPKVLALDNPNDNDPYIQIARTQMAEVRAELKKVGDKRMQGAYNRKVHTWVKIRLSDNQAKIMRREMFDVLAEQNANAFDSFAQELARFANPNTWKSANNQLAGFISSDDEGSAGSARSSVSSRDSLTDLENVTGAVREQHMREEQQDDDPTDAPRDETRRVIDVSGSAASLGETGQMIDYAATLAYPLEQEPDERIRDVILEAVGRREEDTMWLQASARERRAIAAKKHNAEVSMQLKLSVRTCASNYQLDATRAASDVSHVSSAITGLLDMSTMVSNDTPTLQSQPLTVRQFFSGLVRNRIAMNEEARQRYWRTMFGERRKMRVTALYYERLSDGFIRAVPLKRLPDNVFLDADEDQDRNDGGNPDADALMHTLVVQLVETMNVSAIPFNARASHYNLLFVIHPDDAENTLIKEEALKAVQRGALEQMTSVNQYVTVMQEMMADLNRARPSAAQNEPVTPLRAVPPRVAREAAQATRSQQEDQRQARQQTRIQRMQQRGSRR